MGGASASVRPIPLVSTRSSVGYYKIYLDDILHIHLTRADYTGMQAWTWKTFFVLEFPGNGLKVEYDDRNLWVAILKELDAVLEI